MSKLHSPQVLSALWISFTAFVIATGLVGMRAGYLADELAGDPDTPYLRILSAGLWVLIGAALIVGALAIAATVSHMRPIKEPPPLAALVSAGIIGLLVWPLAPVLYGGAATWLIVSNKRIRATP